MRKLIVSSNVTLDGFMAAPNGSLDWHFRYWDNEAGEELNRQLSHADTILLGRNTYQAMATYWPGKGMDLTCPREDQLFIDIVNNYQKVVLSTTLKTAGWNNTIIIDGLDALSALKAIKGKDIVLLGSSRLIKSLLTTGLADEFHIWLHPIVIGSGIPLFTNPAAMNLKLQQHNSFNSGIVRLVYTQQPIIERFFKIG